MEGLRRRDAVLDELQFGALMDHADIFQSLATSLRESAWRKELLTTEVHLKQIRITVNASVEVLKKLQEMAKARKADV